MTTRQWINKNFGVVTWDTKYFGSVMKDPEGNIYSYGYHYPLLFVVGGHTFRNVTGYSNTTGKHIGWSRDIDAIDVHIPSGGPYQLPCLVDIAGWQQKEIDKQRALMDTKKRKTTSVYRWMLHQMGQLITSQTKILEACGL